MCDGLILEKNWQGEEENNDGWETVGKKPPRQRQQVNLADAIS